jgi:hypothetical protein
LLLKHLVEEEGKRDYYSAGGLEGKVILDPMIGGGTTLHEAIRLGANVMGVDIDPIPVLQARATLADVSLADLEVAFDFFYQALAESLSGHFTTNCPVCDQLSPLGFMLYGLRRFCGCGPALFVDSFVFRRETDGTVIGICPHCYEIVSDPEGCDCIPQPDRRPLFLKRTKRCADCGQAFYDDLEIPFYARYVPLMRTGRCPQHRLFFATPQAGDLARIETADKARAEFRADPALAVEPGPKSGDLSRRGIHNYEDLFSSRQVLYLHKAIELLPQFEPLVLLNLALLVSTSLEFNSGLWGYMGGGERGSGGMGETFSYLG